MPQGTNYQLIENPADRRHWLEIRGGPDVPTASDSTSASPLKARARPKPKKNAGSAALQFERYRRNAPGAGFILWGLYN